jgi:hypothetical protein
VATIKPSLLALCLLAANLAGCDQLGIETPDKVAARQEAEGKAIGGACRHSGRALEDCYEINRRASKAAVYAGWRDMDGYMRENNIAIVKPAQSEDEAEAKPVMDANGGAKTGDNTKKTAENTESKPVVEKSGTSVHTTKPAKAATKTS